MHIEELQLKNFRGFEELTLKFPSNFAVLIGVNGSGKSSVLDSISILLTHLLSSVIPKSENVLKGDYPKLERLDITNKISNGKISLDILLYDQCINSCIEETDSGTIHRSGSIRFEEIVIKKLTLEPSTNIPIYIHYRTNREIRNVSLEIPISKQFTFPQFSAYEKCTAINQDDFKGFFQWFRNQEDIENEQRLEHDDQHRDKQLQAVKKAITSLLGDEYTNLRVKRISHLKMIIHKKGQELNINQLSDGEKNLLAMVGDIARRLAIANPSLEDPLKGEGIILIDEIELHLHPQRQREIIPALTSTFPHCQFIVTTHSPQVLSNVEKENVFILEDFELVEITPHTKGRDSNSILYELMGVPKRPEYSQKIIDKCYRLIDQGRMEDAKKELEILSNYLGEDDAQVVELHALIFFRSLTNSRPVAI